MRRATTWLAVIAAGLASLGLGSVASAEFNVCNKSSYAVSAAIGYVEEAQLVTRGWWRLRGGECKRVLTEAVRPGRYFVYAEAIPGHVGDLKTWSGDTTLCVQNDSLFTLRDQDVCADDPRRQRDFFSVDIEEETDGTYTAEFVDENNFTIFSAEVAGVQRLLQDVGRDIQSIDGALGNSTRSALRQYRRDRGLGDSGVIDDTVIDTLITEANGQDAQLGFVFCNATELPVWAAIAKPADAEASEGGGFASSGWWRLDNQDCAKVERGALTEETYYVYGVMEAESRSLPMTGGERPFCIAAVQFEAETDETCEEAGYDTARFRRVETGGAPAYTFRFTPDQFNPDLENR